MTGDIFRNMLQIMGEITKLSQMVCMQMKTLVLVTMLATQSLSHQLGMVNLAISTAKETASKSFKLCQSLGYDGLGVLNTPEEYAHALRISKPLRLAESAGFYIGLRKLSSPKRIVWDDGSTLATDLPLVNDDDSRGIISLSGLYRMVDGSHPIYSFCGKYNSSTMMEAYGTTVHGREPADTSFKLSESTASSYIECVVMCSQETLCRLVNFRSDISSCTLLGPGTLNVTIENTVSTTFIRVSFEAMYEKYA
ncbi:hypothetical protein PoB_001682200 [Plakobranchus ocellatus]|uniref:Apple domain-containing protein n=1 Tax=Plakobranchus ocellatus TaxID=259542 RepID=A0AAV3Z4Z4_9GAST|nr:hypothetical protein PoB_001682200 [Plakobranchus ocellatus]